MTWYIMVGTALQEAGFPTLRDAVESYTDAWFESGMPEEIKEPGVFVVSHENTAYRLAYESDTGGALKTCMGTIYLDHAPGKTKALDERDAIDRANTIWLNERERWASVSSHFDQQHTYRHHVAVWYDKRIGWIHGTPGDSFREAVWNARNMRFDYDTCEYFDPLTKMVQTWTQ